VESKRQYVGDGVYVEFDSGFRGNTVLVTSDGRTDTNRIALEPEVWVALMMLRERPEPLLLARRVHMGVRDLTPAEARATAAQLLAEAAVVEGAS
jgi:hypothetical protein